jgi:hypothetical protein
MIQLNINGTARDLDLRDDTLTSDAVGQQSGTA